MKYAKKGYNRLLVDDQHNWEMDGEINREMEDIYNFDLDDVEDQAILDIAVDDIYNWELDMFEKQVIRDNPKQNRKTAVRTIA